MPTLARERPKPMTRLTHVAGRFPLPVLKRIDALVGEAIGRRSARPAVTACQR